MKKKEQKEKQVNVDYEIEQKRNSNKRLMAYAKASEELKKIGYRRKSTYDEI